MLTIHTVIECFHFDTGATCMLLFHRGLKIWSKFAEIKFLPLLLESIMYYYCNFQH